MMKCKSCCVIFGGKKFQIRTRVCMVLHKVKNYIRISLHICKVFRSNCTMNSKIIYSVVLTTYLSIWKINFPKNNSTPIFLRNR